jgi:hypothetical protein
MKTAGEIASALFDEQFMKKAKGYSKLFDSWAEITAKNGIAAAAAHSRIKEIDRGILLVEMDHPGWKQIIQTKQSQLLEDFQKRFPEMEIEGIALILGSGGSEQVAVSSEQREDIEGREVELSEGTGKSGEREVEISGGTEKKGFDAIKDEDFKEKLKSLGQSIAEREKKS